MPKRLSQATTTSESEGEVMTYQDALDKAANVVRWYAETGPDEGGILPYSTLIEVASELDSLGEYVQEVRLDESDDYDE